MNYYNIALIPTSPDVAEAFVMQAQSVKLYSDGYLLGTDTQPHVTLCQFKVEETAAPEEIWALVKDLPSPTSLECTDLALREGLQSHAGFDWLEWLVIKSDGLIHLQKRIYDILADSEHYLIPLTPWEHYSPHVTLSRVFERSVFLEDSNLNKDGISEFAVTLALGQSTPNGEWRQTLKIL